MLNKCNVIIPLNWEVAFLFVHVQANQTSLMEIKGETILLLRGKFRIQLKICGGAF